MDLHVVAPLASPAERAAVDSVLDPEIGPPVSAWRGGVRSDSTAHAARGGHEARSRRDLLLPALHAVQARMGWISQPAMSYVCRRLTVPPAEAYGVATFYAMFATSARPPMVAHVCDDIACRLAGAEETCAALDRSIGPAGEAARDGRATWLRSPCLGLCERAPAAMFTIAGDRPRTFVAAPVDAAGIAGRLEAESQDGGTPTVIAAAAVRAADVRAADVPTAVLPTTEVRAAVPQVGQAGLRLLARVGRVSPTSLDDYRKAGGYRGLASAVAAGPRSVIEAVTASGLLGRGGAAFPTGRKWAAVADQSAQPHYVVCNADESEPGTFKDRILLEEDPFSIVEAMTIAAFAVGAARGFLYLRGEYPLAAERTANAIDRARVAGLLGNGILGSDLAFDIELRRGAGAYIAGEETALFNAIEGKRAEPRNKPPFPVAVGLFGKPTLVNNVETLANVNLIMADADGGRRFAETGTSGSTGTKLFCLSGHVARPGLYEVPFGTTLRELLMMGGGVPSVPSVPKDGLDEAVRAVLLGGAAGVFVGPDALDTPLTFEGTRAIGATLGSGVVMVFDQSADMIGTLRRIAAFFRDESCGQCVPCRVGTVRQEELLARLASDRPLRGPGYEVELLREIGQAMRDASICGLGQTASSAIESAIRQMVVAP
jgi:NADH-quinone oxidoreductase subunit F